jgi:dienelactone hydrolase
MSQQLSLSLVVALIVLLCHHAGSSLASSDTLDPATHHAAPPSAWKGVGHEEKLMGMDVYVSGSPSASKVVLMISDVFGWKGPLFRKLADKFAAAGYYVVAPDFFYGDPLVNVSDITTWLPKHPPAGAVDTTNKLVDTLKSKGAHAVGIAGFCWGSKVGVLVAKQKHRIKVLAQAHPAFVNATDYEEVAVPISVLAAPEDGVQQFRELLRRRKREEHLKVFVKIFKGVVHGWTIRYDDKDPIAVKHANRAHGLMLKWLKKYL